MARLGVLSYQNIEISMIHPLLSVLVFAAFGTMFYKMSIKHSLALALAGVLFWIFYIKDKNESSFAAEEI